MKVLHAHPLGPRGDDEKNNEREDVPDKYDTDKRIANDLIAMDQWTVSSESARNEYIHPDRNPWRK